MIPACLGQLSSACRSGFPICRLLVGGICNIIGKLATAVTSESVHAWLAALINYFYQYDLGAAARLLFTLQGELEGELTS